MYVYMIYMRYLFLLGALKAAELLRQASEVRLKARSKLFCSPPGSLAPARRGHPSGAAPGNCEMLSASNGFFLAFNSL